MTFTKEQLSELMCKHAERENGLHDLMEIMLESLMLAERGTFLSETKVVFQKVCLEFSKKLTSLFFTRLALYLQEPWKRRAEL